MNSAPSNGNGNSSALWNAVSLEVDGLQQHMTITVVQNTFKGHELHETADRAHV